MTAYVLPLLAGTLTGILSSWGVGGGTLLLLVMTLLLGVEPETARIINLLYFLPTAGVSAYLHRKNGLIDTAVVRHAVPWGVAASALGAMLALIIDIGMLRRPFGIYLLIAGGSMLFGKKEQRSSR